MTTGKLPPNYMLHAGIHELAELMVLDALIDGRAPTWEERSKWLQEAAECMKYWGGGKFGKECPPEPVAKCARGLMALAYSPGGVEINGKHYELYRAGDDDRTQEVD